MPVFRVRRHERNLTTYFVEAENHSDAVIKINEGTVDPSYSKFMEPLEEWGDDSIESVTKTPFVGNWVKR
jgi:hypothetical protein